MVDAVVKPQTVGLRSYLVAALSVIAATLLICYFPMLKQRGAFVVYLAVVSLVTWFSGWRPGILVIVLSALAAAWVIMPPDDSLGIQNWEDGLRLTLYLLVALIIASLHASRERALQHAWQTEQRLAFALHTANMGAWYSDLKTGKFWWSEGMERLFGRPPGQFSGTYEGFIGYIHPDDQDFVKRAVTRTIERGREFEIEHRIVRPDGQVCWIETRGRIVCDAAGNPQQVIGVAIDVSERKLREQAATMAMAS